MKSKRNKIKCQYCQKITVILIKLSTYPEQQSSIEKSTESGEESLTIFNESDSNPWNGRGYISQLTTPRATPHLSPASPSPRSSLWSCDPGSGLPWLSQSAGLASRARHPSSPARASAPPGAPEVTSPTCLGQRSNIEFIL